MSETTTLGQQLAAARQHHGLTVAQVAEQLLLSEEAIQAIETDESNFFPAVYWQGHVKRYAALLGVPLEPVHLSALAASGQVTVDAHLSAAPLVQVRTLNGLRHRMRWLIGLGVLAFLMVVLFMWRQADVTRAIAFFQSSHHTSALRTAGNTFSLGANAHSTPSGHGVALSASSAQVSQLTSSEHDPLPSSSHAAATSAAPTLLVSTNALTGESASDNVASDNGAASDSDSALETSQHEANSAIPAIPAPNTDVTEGAAELPHQMAQSTAPNTN